MGSKSPEGHQQGPDGHGQVEKPCDSAAGRSRSSSASSDIDRGIVGEDEDGEDNDDGDAGLRSNGNAAKSPSKPLPPPSNSPPSFPNNTYPPGQQIPYPTTSAIASAEALYTTRLWTQSDPASLPSYRQAAEVHRQVRQHIQTNLIHPGVTLQTIAAEIESGVRNLSGEQGLTTGSPLRAGLAFPTGLCLNNIAAHWTPNPGGRDVVLRERDVLSVDFGVHGYGWIVDSAFTVCCASSKSDPLLEAVRQATETGLALAGVDARMREVGEAVQEVMESFEVGDNRTGRVERVRAVRGLTGHDILRYRIHGEKQVPFRRNGSEQKMEEGDVFAIETFGSTGKGILRDDIGVYGYGRQDVNISPSSIPTAARSLLKTIDSNFGSIVFCRRYLERLGVKNYHLGMKHLVDQGIVESYSPLVDREGSHVAQSEHTVLIGSGGKEIISRGEDD